jgi:clan AA aspartic protease
MGKVMEEVRRTNALDRTRSLEVEAVIDTGATMLVMPLDLVQQLGLEKVRDVRIQYANGMSESKTIYGIVKVELKGRMGNFDVLAEAEGSQPLVGQIVLKELDLVVDPRSPTLTPNPLSPDMPMIEIL